MGKYLILWEADQARIPVDPQERATSFLNLTKVIKGNLESGALKDWGSYVGGGKGYATFEGTEVDLGKLLQPFVPFIQFDVHPISTIDQVGEVLKSLT